MNRPMTTFDLERYLADQEPMAFRIRAEWRNPEAEARAAELQNTLESLTTRAEEIQRGYESENREPTPAEAGRVKRILAEFNEADAELKQLKYDHFELPGAGRRTQPAAPGAGNLGGGGAQGGRRSSARAITGNPRLFANMFLDNPPSPEGFTDFQAFMQDIHYGRMNPNIRAATGASEGTGADGGFYVPSMFIGNMMDASLEGEIVRPLADVVPLTSNIVDVPFWDNLDHTGGAIGGFTGVWLAEAGAATRQKGKARMISMRAKKLGIFTSVTNELLEDSALFTTRFELGLRESAGYSLDDAFLTGSGAGKPRGVLNDLALIAVAKEAGQVADTILYENLSNMFARMYPAGQKRAVWVANSSTIPQLTRLSIKFKNVAETENVGGAHVPVQSDGDGNFRILTRPVLFTEKLPTLGDQGDIIFADFSQYMIGLRREGTIERNIAPGWTTDESDYRIVVRVDGQGKWNKVMTPKTGNTLSWCVTLLERA